MKIFLSSTYRDLKKDRKIAINFLEKIVGTTTDTKTGDIIAMEFFEASANEPKKVCLDKIRKCDLVLGLYGSRYGTEDDTGKSMTECEYDCACKEKIPVLAFVKKAQKRDTKQEIFIKKISKGKNTPAYYGSSKELPRFLDNSLKVYFKDYEGYSYESLWDVVYSLQKELRKRAFQMTPLFSRR